MIDVRCPVCDREMKGHSTRDWPEFPFCGPKCRLIDLGRWLGERYRVPSEAERTPPAQPEQTEIP